MMQTTITPATITEHHKQLTHAQVGRKILSLNPLFINSSNLNMKKLLLLSMFVAAVIAPALPSHAGGLIVVNKMQILPQPGSPVRPRSVTRSPVYRFAPMEVLEQKVNIKVIDQIAETTVNQVFYNPNRSRLEGHFIFPVPKGAVLTDFRMDIDGKMMKAELLKAEKARKIYTDIVRKAQDPALLEYAGNDLYRVRIFPIEPRSTKRTRVTYKQVLRKDSGLVSYKYPLNTGKYSAKPIRTLSVKMEIESKTPLKSIYSPSHEVEVKRDGANKAVISYEENNILPKKSFAVYYTPQKTGLSLNLLTHRPDGDKDGYFLLLLSPGIDVKQEDVVEKDVAFVLDTSGSMAGEKIKQAKKALEFCLHNLNEGDRFEVVRFSTEAETLFSELKEVSKASREKALNFVKDLKPSGGTAINDAMTETLKLRPRDSKRPFVVIFLTDGLPTMGITGEDQIVKNVKDAAGKTRVFCFGIGNNVNTHLLDKITESTRAFSQYVLPSEDIEIKVSRFYAKINDPVMADPEVEVSGEAKLKQFYPKTLPDLFKGDQVVVMGRYSGEGAGDLLLTGMVNGKEVKMEYQVEFVSESDEHDFIPRLWATRRVGYLLDEIRLHGENKELKDEVTTLAKKYGIVTPYTSYLILEDERANNVAANQRLLQANPRARQALRENWSAMQNQKSGAGAVAAARAQQNLMLANWSRLSTRHAHLYRAAQQAQQAAGQAANKPGPGGKPGGQASEKKTARGAGGGQVVRFVSGKSFYQNAGRWIDSEIQTLKTKTKKIRIKFGSTTYFKLMTDKPAILKWISLGKHVEFVLDGIHYEIYEDTNNK
jgi:Ca-activated chloride channel family protein